MIDHHPDAAIAGLRVFRRPGVSTDASADDELIRTAWDNALKKYPDSPDVLLYAGLFLQANDPLRALQLFTHAAALGPAGSPARENAWRAMSFLYASAIIADSRPGDPRPAINDIVMDPNVATALHSQIESSRDPELLSNVGTALVQIGQDEEGLSLIQRAIDLDPSDPKWKEAEDWAKAEPVRRRNLRELRAGTVGAGIRIGAAVAEANLLKKVEPKYPASALPARLSGTVEFTVDIDPDGKVRSLRLDRGHPLFVSAAKDAVMQWVYRPTLLNGKGVAVTTTVAVHFAAPEQ